MSCVRFRINAKHFFLTYPRCPVSKESCDAQLRVICTGRGLKGITVGQEEHAATDIEGCNKEHLHCLVSLKDRWDVGSCELFNIKDDHGRWFRANLQPARNWRHVYTYCIKDGNYISDHKGETDWSKLITESGTLEEFMSAVEFTEPRTAVLHHTQVRAFAEYKFRAQSPAYESPYVNTSWMLPEVLSDWRRDNVIRSGWTDDLCPPSPINYYK